MTAVWMAALAATLGVIVGALVTRRWHLPTAEKIAADVKVLGGTGSVTVLSAIAAFFGVCIVVASGAFLSLVHEWIVGRPLDPSSFWKGVLDSILVLIALMAGVGAGQKIGHRATSKPEIVAAEGKVAAEMKVAEAKADVVRKSGAIPAIPDEPLREDAP